MHKTKTHLNLFFLIVVAPILIGQLYGQATSIPDPAFENELILQGIDTNGPSGDILNTDAQGIINLNVTSAGISDLTGIGAFVDLQVLDCEDNMISALDLSGNANLTTLDCQQNQISSLNISACTQLVSLSCQENLLTTLNVSNNTILSALSFQDNLLSTIDLTTNTELFQIIGHGNDLTTITFPSSADFLQIIWLYDNLLEQIDLTAYTGLATIQFQDNALTQLDLRNGTNTFMHTMDARNNPNLQLICVDDITYSTNAPNWTKDVTSTYSETCTLTSVDLETNNFSLSPNPVENELKINYNYPLNISTVIHIFDMQGRRVFTKLVGEGSLQSTLDLSILDSGTYVLTSINNSKKLTYKIIKR